ncbi:MAG: 23S rRNA (pseudouridine(1915)-N(3))-methyltransferase RlmH [Proteobacteria bacterium]|nr:23S rRNA (pseudouridine(1915)-N(3))-methyltransferase RlmH [Pseudomonadota bacterium]MBU1547390.1 23S rRNA (pseudouridine(1915)-N(3))-methyltransferase RlmH [Pseudomonadota bacterium]MBU2619002.1 23S rRNA (pseudouridine(1915)-N(3))-methyltransferase RlmH [Pseudomonadota bacterium]
MKIILPLLGKTKEQYLGAGIDDFAGRLRRFVQLELPVLKEKKSGAKEDAARLQNEEAQILLGSVPQSAKVVALAPLGQQLSSEELADLLCRWEDQGVREIVFLIGGPTGLAPKLVEKADYVLSLSRMTFTHEMARMLVLEQLYRAFSIKAGTGYHK